MEDYLIDRDTLEKFIDELLKEKPKTTNDVDEQNMVKEKMMQTLDDRINKAMLKSLNDEQLEELEQMLDRGDESPEAYSALYKKAGVDLESLISKEMESFGEEYLGGENE